MGTVIERKNVSVESLLYSCGYQILVLLIVFEVLILDL